MSTKSDVIILTLASRAAGVVTRSDLIDAGVPSSTITQRAKRGFLMTVWAGLYEVPELTGPTTPLFRAVKSASGSAISEISAGRIWSAPLPLPDIDEPVHITAPWGGPRTEMPGVVLHRTRRPLADDVSYPIPGLPTLSPARTLLDLAGVSTISKRRLRHIAESLVTSGVLDPGELVPLLDRPGLRGVSGAGRLRAIVDHLMDDEPMAESMLERKFERLLVDYGVDGFQRQLRPPWYDGRRGMVDFANPMLRLIVEVDGRRWHMTSQAMTEDRRRDRAAAVQGWQVLRVTWADLTDDPTRTADQVAGTVAARRKGSGQFDAA